MRAAISDLGAVPLEVRSFASLVKTSLTPSVECLHLRNLGPGFGIGQRASMKKISEYRLHAEECRLLAERADSPGHRDMLLSMAATWDALADGRKRNLARQGRGESEGLGGVAAAAGDNSQARAEDEKAG